jgi:hypothetical protein
MKRAKIAEKVPRSLGGFGEVPSVSPAEIYIPMPKLGRKARTNGGGTGSVTTKNELILRLTDYFDYTTFDSTAGGVAQPVNNYYWSINQNLLDTAGSPPGGQEQTLCRVRSVCVWVMPLSRSFAASVAGEPQPINNATAMYTVNVQTPGVGTQFSSTTQAFALNTQVTNVLPTINPKWKKVFACDLQKTFQSGTVRPVFAANSPSSQCLFQMSVVDPTDGSTYLQNDDQIPIRVKVQLMLDQPIATVQAAELAVFRNEEFALPYTEQNGAPFAGTSEQYVQLDLTKAADMLS